MPAAIAIPRAAPKEKQQAHTEEREEEPFEVAHRRGLRAAARCRRIDGSCTPPAGSTLCH